MNINFPIVLLAALVPMVIGFLWYGPLFGKAWMKASGMTPEMAREASMVKVFGFSFLFCVMVSFVLQFLVIHQYSLSSLIQGDQSETSAKWLADSMAAYGGRFRTFGHGMVHGFMTGFLLALPFVGMSALYERRSAAYIFIHAGYWTVSLMLMGGVLCQFS